MATTLITEMLNGRPDRKLGLCLKFCLSQFTEGSLVILSVILDFPSFSYLQYKRAQLDKATVSNSVTVLFYD